MNPADHGAPELAAIEVRGTTRSAFLTRTALAAGAVFGLGAVQPVVQTALAQGSGDVEIVNFALTLEYLEAAFYERGLKEVSGLSSDVRKLAEELRDNEEAHVQALAGTVRDLGGKPAQKPEFDFGKAFSGEAAFLKLANTLEDTGVSAYNGAGPSIKSKDVLAAAGTIVQVEARHAALVRLLRDKPPSPQTFDKASDVPTVLKAIQPLIAS